MEHFQPIEKPLVLLGCAYLSWKIIRHIWGVLKTFEKEPVTVLVTGAAGMHACSLSILYFFFFLNFWISCSLSLSLFLEFDCPSKHNHVFSLLFFRV